MDRKHVLEDFGVVKLVFKIFWVAEFESDIYFVN